ncbi:cytochrome c peroxidase [Daejeonella rubra]|uniref:Cytochrome c peroxidase n=1 Tax=Daejeonella rubra TaxID=990371 RepID=A0A1G9T9L8_9SPHI|nr:cytochrome c peroxidase [Daejeonella rubra]SDM44302.1 cytochrome c peroxidase [Daejeonella rubra]
MKNILKVLFTICFLVIIAASCSKSDSQSTPELSFPAIKAAFGDNIDLNSLSNYSGQIKPAYIIKDNTGANPILNAKATLGRVLFYDKSLSVNNSVSCSSCHKQEFAFSDSALVSSAILGGVTARHSMRLVNSRFAVEQKFFWDERAASLELQTTQPMMDHSEMGFSGQNGRPAFSTLLTKLQGIPYYNELFKFAYNDVNVTESRLQECLAQFIRSIQSFDSKYDAGRVQVANDNQNFPNFTAEENSGKNLFITPPVFDANSSRIAGGVGCNACHNAPEFDIDPNSRNNGIIGVINGANRDLTVTRAPSLRDLTRVGGRVNSPMMHTGANRTVRAAINHYNTIALNQNQNPNLDARLAPNRIGQSLNLTENEVSALVAFLQTLSGTNVYTDKKWSDPFL